MSDASASANPWRGEASIMLGGQNYLLRPTFSALVSAEEEIGPLFAMVERAADGKLRLVELTALFWHCLAEPGNLTRERLGESLIALGLAEVTGPLRTLLAQILQGAG